MQQQQSERLYYGVKKVEAARRRQEMAARHTPSNGGLIAGLRKFFQ